MSDVPPRLILPPHLEWTDGQPCNIEYGDVYYSCHDGLLEAKTVFLEACGLPQSMVGKRHFCVGELGFGTGLNLLALMAARAKNPGALATKLHFLSFDSQLMEAKQAASAHKNWPELEPWSQRLIAQWPPAVRGVHRLELGEGVCLTLCLDEIERALPDTIAMVHAWFLDGFSPAKNPQMWSPSVFAQLARLSAPQARFGTWSSAALVRKGLEDVGFSVQKSQGFAGKRDRLSGVFTPQTAPSRSIYLASESPQSVLIIGAGIAGAACAQAFLAEGCAVNVLDAQGPASATSGNSLALVAPRLDATDTPTARAMLESFLQARQAYARVPKDCAQSVQITHLATDERQRQKLARLSANPPLPPDLWRFDAIDKAIVSGFIIRPKALIAHWLSGARLHRARVCAIETDPEPHVRTDQGQIFAADLIIIACGTGIRDFCAKYPFQFSAGQIETAQCTQAQTHAIMDGQYVLQWDDRLVFGSGFTALAPGEAASTNLRAQADNYQALYRLRPDMNTPDERIRAAKSRASIRVSLPDRLPLLGWMPKSRSDAHNVMIAAGLGARGFGFAPLIGSCLVSMACAYPLPVERSALNTLLPERYCGARSSDSRSRRLGVGGSNGV